MALLSVGITVSASAIIELAWLKKERNKQERKKERKKEDRRFGRLANYRLGTPVMISISADSLVVDENTRE